MPASVGFSVLIRASLCLKKGVLSNAMSNRALWKGWSQTTSKTWGDAVYERVKRSKPVCNTLPLALPKRTHSVCPKEIVDQVTPHPQLALGSFCDRGT